MSPASYDPKTGGTIWWYMTDEEAAEERAAEMERESRGEFPHIVAIPARVMMHGGKQVSITRVEPVADVIARLDREEKTE